MTQPWLRTRTLPHQPKLSAIWWQWCEMWKVWLEIILWLERWQQDFANNAGQPDQLLLRCELEIACVTRSGGRRNWINIVEMMPRLLLAVIFKVWRMCGASLSLSRQNSGHSPEMEKFIIKKCARVSSHPSQHICEVQLSNKLINATLMEQYSSEWFTFYKFKSRLDISLTLIQWKLYLTQTEILIYLFFWHHRIFRFNFAFIGLGKNVPDHA